MDYQDMFLTNRIVQSWKEVAAAEVNTVLKALGIGDCFY